MNKVFAFTPTYGERGFLRDTVKEMREKAGMDFDWGVWGGGLGSKARETAEELLREGEIQHLTMWPQNRGQHHAMADALKYVREHEYDWLCRIDDDVRARTKRWLKKMVTRCDELRDRAKDVRRRIVAAPRMTKLKNPLRPIAVMQLGQDFPVEGMEFLGGMVRLHPVGILDGFEPDVFAPKGRRDPEQIEEHVRKVDGMQIRFPDVRVVHDTQKIEEADSKEAALVRRMGYYWPYLGAEA